MSRWRLFSQVVSALGICALVPSLGAAQVVPYQSVSIGGRNNVYDIDLSMCQGAGGCIDRIFEACTPDPNDPTGYCQVRAVPEGRCAAGSTTNSANGDNCIWNDPNNTAAHRCSTSTTLQCVTDAHCPPGETCDTGLGAIPLDVANCACTPETEQIVCGLSVQARCSDGDPALGYGGPGGLAVCREQVVGGSPHSINCGTEGSQPLTGPRDAGFENAPSLVTLQRGPGGELTTIGDIYTLRSTRAIELGDVDPNWGIRRFRVPGNSIWSDWEFVSGEVIGTGPLRWTQAALPFDVPGGWQTEHPQIGECDGLGLGVPAGTLCFPDPNGCPWPDSECGLDPNTFENAECTLCTDPYGRAVDEVGFLFTQDVPDSAPTTCPPRCGLDYDHQSYEQQAIEAVAADQFEAGAQLALDSLVEGPSGRAGEGDAISLSRTFLYFWTSQDVRCFVGGDPGRPDPNDSRIGICSFANALFVPSPCDPATEPPGDAGDCVAGATCEYCGGPFDPNTNPLALPLGYDDRSDPGDCAPGFDCSALRLEGRMGGRNGETFGLKVPLFVISTTGMVRAAAVDPDCFSIGGFPSCLLGEDVAVGGVGIGSGGAFAPGFAFPAFNSVLVPGPGATDSTCCDTGAPIPWAAESPGTVPGQVATGDWLPGPGGIPGCIGDNVGAGPPFGTAPACDPNGGGLLPGTSNPGADDIPRFSVNLNNDPNLPLTNATATPRQGDPGTGPDRGVPNPLAGDATAAGLPGSLEDPNGAPTLRLSGASSAIDLNLLGTANADWLMKEGRVWCPVRSGGADCYFDPDLDGIDSDFDNCPDVANPGQENADADPLGDACDNCPFRDNADQLDQGGVSSPEFLPGDGSPDGVGDACQCGDMNEDGVVDASDVVLYRRKFGGQVSPFSTDLCSVVGGDGACDASDVVIMRRTFGGQTVGILDFVCPAYVGLPDPGTP